MRGGVLSHIDFLLLLKLSKNGKSLLLLALMTVASRHLDLVFHFLCLVQDLDGNDALRRDWLPIGSVLGLIEHNLCLNGLLDHWLLHSLHHIAWLLHTSCCHVHLMGHIAGVGIRLIVD